VTVIPSSDGEISGSLDEEAVTREE